jgi:hypothetical protein
MEKSNFNELKKFFLAFFLILFCSCGKEKKSNFIYLYSKETKQVVTIISNYNNNERFICVGKHTSIPEVNYIKLDISKTTKFDDEFGICWNINGHIWEMVNDKSKIINSKLDTSKYVFRESWFKDKNGTSTPKYYRENNCFTVSAINYSKHKPQENGFVERH